jgi:Tfp pilus assembly protein PilF
MKPKTSYILLLLVTLILFSCNDKLTKKQQITNSDDYSDYLNIEPKEALDFADKELVFWTQKLEKTPNQYPYLSKIASAHNQEFAISGNIDALLESENALVKLNEKTKYTKASYLRALARNYISQHKFKKALTILLKAETQGENLQATQKMLFDVYLELGFPDKAVCYLGMVTNFSDFDYLIRLSKYSDYNGDLDNAINYLEKALVIAEASNLDTIKQWTYTNLADYYGHAGKIKDAYEHYLKALTINKSDAYAKKGIAWIVYSYERNPEEALRILNTVTLYNQSPDYYLLKSEIADFMNDDTMKEKHLNTFRNKVSNEKYGDMYNAYLIDLSIENYTSTKDAIVLAKKEVRNRATPQTYDLLAWSYLKNGYAKKALEIMQKHVINKTFEPVALYHIAEVYKANRKEEAAQKLKLELLEAVFELGPIAEQIIKKI